MNRKDAKDAKVYSFFFAFFAPSRFNSSFCALGVLCGKKTES